MVTFKKSALCSPQPWNFISNLCNSSLISGKSSFAKPPLNPTFAAMFQKLQSKWKVGGWQLLLILCTFAIGGSLTGWVGRKIMHWLNIDDGWFFFPVYILILTLVWPAMVLLVSIPFGQFRFFVSYLNKMGVKLGIISSKKQN